MSTADTTLLDERGITARHLHWLGRLHYHAADAGLLQLGEAAHDRVWGRWMHQPTKLLVAMVTLLQTGRYRLLINRRRMRLVCVRPQIWNTRRVGSR
jgi:hypothetical protein